MKLWTAHRFYRLMHRLSDVEFPVDAGDFRLVDRRVADVVRGMREPDRYLRGMFAWVGFRQTSVSYDRDERFAGKTKNSLAEDDQLRDRRDPRLLGGAAALHPRARLRDLALSLAWGLVAIVVKLAGSVPPGGQGWASLTVLVTFLAGVQLIVLGMIGLYVARAYEQGKHRPLYLVASAEGLEAGPSGPLREHRVLRAQRQPAESTLDPSQ